MKFPTLLLACNVAAVLAAPTEELENVQKRDVSATLLSNMELFSQYTAASYCSATYSLSSGSALTCTTDNCPLVVAANATAYSVFSDSVSGIDGYVAIDATNSLIVVAFRGTVNLRNFIDALFFEYTLCDLVAGCLVHAGFWTAWLDLRTEVLAQVAAAVATHSTYTVVVTGHSLGGALASLAAAELRKAGTAADLYTYGSPRVGNSIWANFVTAQSGTTVRVTHTNDPVPRLPPILFSYRHISPEYWIKVGEYTVDASNIEVLDGIANTKGNAGQSGFNITAHSYYFGDIGACDTEAFSFKRDVVTEPQMMQWDETFIAGLGNTTLLY